MIFYIADIHFGHQKIFDYCNRPFYSLEEMEKIIIEKWNNKVKQNDVVYILGDIANENDKNSVDIYKKLNGEKHLIAGNHDYLLLDYIIKSGIFKSIKHIDLIKDSGHKVCVCHYPMLDWLEYNNGSILIYGHIHNKTIKNGYEYKQIKDYYSDKPAYNCGVDVIDFEPRTLKELIYLKEKNKDESYIN